MPRACREYITLQASSVPVENYYKDCAILDSLEELARGKRYSGHVVPVYSSKDMEIEDLDAEEILAASEGQLPVIFVNVTFHTEELSAADFAEWEARFSLKLLGEMVASF